MIQTPFSYTYSVLGAGVWLLLVVLITAAACYVPARSAAQLTIRESLAYE
jgi:putative ABC transport system permease protein